VAVEVSEATTVDPSTVVAQAKPKCRLHRIHPAGTA
jgi:hypothetical protein